MKERDNITEEDTELLKAFLQDITCLDPLYSWIKEPNIFDILKLERTEIRHSNMLAWFLDPNGNHGFENRILKGFVNYWLQMNGDDSSCNGGLEIYLKDLSDAMVFREIKSNIDILVVSHNDKLVLTVENKIDSKERKGQLEKYYNFVEGGYRGYNKLYLYLTPDGAESSKPEIWTSMSYSEVLNILETAEGNVDLTEKSKLIVNDYIDCLRRNVVGDSELTKICDEIYKSHELALKLIYDNKTDEVRLLNGKISELLDEDGSHLNVSNEIGQDKHHIR